eukprot:9467693-Pyramimonas_sp.AAC.1
MPEREGWRNRARPASSSYEIVPFTNLAVPTLSSGGQRAERGRAREQPESGRPREKGAAGSAWGRTGVPHTHKHTHTHTRTHTHTQTSDLRLIRSILSARPPSHPLRISVRRTHNTQLTPRLLVVP